MNKYLHHHVAGRYSSILVLKRAVARLANGLMGQERLPCILTENKCLEETLLR